LTRIIRASVLRGITPGHEGKSAQELKLQARAIHAISEYRLVKDRVASYAELGYSLPDGRIIGVKMLEYLAIDADYADAIEDKQRK
jgi:hypothetical protein